MTTNLIRVPTWDFQTCPLYGVQTVDELVSVLFAAGYLIDHQGLGKLVEHQHLYKNCVIVVDDLTGKRRACEVPTRALKHFQKWLNSLFQEWLQPNTPDYLYSFRSPLDNARVHVNEYVTVRLDVHSFFRSTREVDVVRFWRVDMGMSHEVANLLTALCTYNGHLPTGAPGSPILSFLVYRRMWEAVARFSRQHGYVFTLYIDDLVISGTPVHRYHVNHIKNILKQSGFSIATGKTRWFREGQAKHITGVIIQWGGQLDVPHKTHWRLNERIKQLEKVKSQKERKRLAKQVKGLQKWILQVEQANHTSIG